MRAILSTYIPVEKLSANSSSLQNINSNVLYEGHAGLSTSYNWQQNQWTDVSKI
jgi:hypothetical protein